MKKFGLVMLAMVFAASAANATDWGTIKGKILVKGDIPEAKLRFKKGTAKDPEICSATDVIDNDLLIDKETRGVANCFVYLYRTPDEINDEGVDKTATVYFDQEKCFFKPHAMIVRVGQTIEVLNSDPISHNTRTTGSRLQVSTAVGPKTGKGDGAKIETEDKERTPVKVLCDFHSKMKAYWLVVEHPYAALTNEKGEFTIKNLPVGEHEFRVWHERCGWVEKNFEVNVTKGESEVSALEVDIEKFEED